MPKRLPKSSLEVAGSNLGQEEGNVIEASRDFSQLLHAKTCTEPQIRQGQVPSTFLPHFNPLFTLPWLAVSTRKVLRPANSAQVFLGFPLSKSECSDGSQDCNLLLHTSHVALLT
jgi:hypothetical protein